MSNNNVSSNNSNKDEIKKGRRKTTTTNKNNIINNADNQKIEVVEEVKVETKIKKPRTKKTKVEEVETEVETKVEEVVEEIKEPKTKKPRAKKTKVEEVKEEEKVDTKVEEVKEEPKPKKPRAKKTKEVVETIVDTKVDTKEEEEPKPKKPRAKKTKVNEEVKAATTSTTNTTTTNTKNNNTKNNNNNNNNATVSISNETINKYKNLGRLHIINFINTSWYIQINQFLEEHPAFYKLIPIVALDEYPNGFNKNPHEDDKDAPKNIFEIVLYGLAFAGADIDYGKYQYLMMQNYFRECGEIYKDMEMPEDAQPEKVPIYKALVNKLIENNISTEELMYCPEHMEVIESVEGMTESTVTLLYLLFDEVTRDRCLPYGDKQFKRGMSMFYELENPTKEELKAITDTWTNKKVGLMFVVQYAHYSEYV
jgi:chemotaxis protein histidine kinase CheA